MTAADRARASREAQGLPERIEDPAVLARVATLIATSTPSRRGEGA